MTLQLEGAVRLKGLIACALQHWNEVCGPYFDRRLPGVRISNDPALADTIRSLLASRPVLDLLGEGKWQCVRAIAFDKASNSNWALGWHQDRTIAVKRKADVAGYGPWSIKQGIQHVEPPFTITDRMRTLRLHFDHVDDSNGALLVAPGSHLLGKISDRETADIANRTPALSCHADAGDAWLYSTPILHASARSVSKARRRVLQLDLSRDGLPYPLEWLVLD